MEIALITNDISALIATGAPATELRRVAVNDGYKSLYQEGLVQVIAGNTSFDEINCLSYTAMA
jgi:type II secretory ATPase GspE/PulE/Tfp pilus assembly ATPase PilB-like protein